MTVTLGHLADVAAGQIVAANGASADIAAMAKTPILGVELNAADVAAGGMFAALPGTRTHGAKYAQQSAGAAILTDSAGLHILQDAGDTRPVLVVEDIRSILGEVAAEIHGHPSQSLTIVGVTGTSGKTTTTFMLEGALLAAGCGTGIIGTTGTRINGRAVPSNLTTPEAPALQRLFRQMLDDGVTHVVMEVSSHALSLGRVNGVQFDVGCLLNLSQDHLDFHNTFQEYFEAKAALFAVNSPVHAPKAVVCVDDNWGVHMADVAAGDAAVELSVVTTPHSTATEQVSAEAAHVWRATDATIADNGIQEVTITDEKATAPSVGTASEAGVVDESRVTTRLHIPLPGAFNVANASVAWAALAAIGQANEAAREGLANVRVPGRMERIDEGQDFLAVVDYAHKPAAIGEVLTTLRAQTSGRVIAVIGAGGDRDTTKRPIMGAKAVRGADIVLVTDDNPRSEQPAAIRAAVLRGAREEAAESSADDVAIIEEIGDRAEAISRAVACARTGDSIVIAGKGHETGQDIGGIIHPFDDREQLQRALREQRK